MAPHKATPDCWEWQEKWASQEAPDEISSCILELRARVEALEAQANHIPDATKMVPLPKPPSLKDQAIAVLVRHGDRLDGAHENTIRRALEALPDD
jgi:hypothetical protein